MAVSFIGGGSRRVRIKQLPCRNLVHEYVIFSFQETPLPGAYESDTFLEHLQKKPNTYRFKSDGRTIDPHPHGKGAKLLPGAYNFPSFLKRFVQLIVENSESNSICSLT